MWAWAWQAYATWLPAGEVAKALSFVCTRCLEHATKDAPRQLKVRRIDVALKDLPLSQCGRPAIGVLKLNFIGLADPHVPWPWLGA